MAWLRSFIALYVRNVLPFATGTAFTMLAIRINYDWYWLAFVGLSLVVIGPLTIQFLLKLVIETFRGLPNANDTIHSKSSKSEPLLRATTSSRFSNTRIRSQDR